MKLTDLRSNIAANMGYAPENAERWVQETFGHHGPGIIAWRAMLRRHGLFDHAENLTDE